MTFEQKITDAKTRQRNRVFAAAIGLLAVVLFCFLIFVFVSPDLFKHDADTGLSTESEQPEIKPASQSPSPSVPDEQLRQNYLDALSQYENTLKPELDKIDLPAWNQARSEQLDQLSDKALVEFTASDYAGAANTIEQRNQLARSTIDESKQAFEQALSNAQKAYQADQYNDAKLQIAQALMLDKSADAAAALAAKIYTMPAILSLLDKINTAKVENKPEKELRLIKELLKIAPDRTSAANRKQALVSRIRQSHFNAAIAKSYQALERGDAQTARQTINSAKKIFPHRQEIADATLSLQNLEKKQRLNRHQQAIQQAITADDWVTVKQQAERVLQERSDDKVALESLKKATTIVALSKTFDESLQHPFRLTNQQLVSGMKSKLAEATALSGFSPSLSKKMQTLSGLMKQVNTKILVEVSSDNQTDISVRGVGKIGKTELKTLHLLPGQYTFEGKRKGFKSKLVQVVVPYDTSSFHLDIRCDEPI